MLSLPRRLLLALLAATLLLAACGSDSDDAESGDDGVSTDDAGDDSADGEPTGDSDDSADDGEATDDSGDSGDDGEATDDSGDSGDDGSAGAGDGNAVLTLDNGESWTFTALCFLEPQISAGQEILYTASSFSDPFFDLTVWGETEFDFGDNVEIGQTEDYTTWDFYYAATDGFSIELDGQTIRGSGTFQQGDDTGTVPFDAEEIPGTVEISC